MRILKDALRQISQAVGFMGLAKDQRRITFYSEGESYWPHLEGLLRELLKESPCAICYLSSSTSDPGLAVKHDNFRAFYIGNGFVRDWLFQNIDTDYMVMTMPDLGKYQVKRSRHNVHYIYVQHSLVSLHMVYRLGAFDHYDTICCAGPHHVKEVRAIEKAYSLPPKRIFKHGYSRLDSLIEEAAQRGAKKRGKGATGGKKRILIAPSWGADGVIESGLGATLVDELIGLGHFVVLRPHPQTRKFAGDRVKEIVKAHKANKHFTFEDSVVGQDSLHQSDIMVSDWSGAALEYAFSLHKPVIFCDVPKKINNPDYGDIDLIPIEVYIRDVIGVIWDGRSSIASCLDQCEAVRANFGKGLAQQHVFNLGSAERKFANFLIQKI